MGRLQGKVALITGAAGGIGLATARRFAQEGAIVAVNDMNKTAGVKEVEEICAAGGKAEFYYGSVTDDDFVKSMMKDVVERFGKLDILINNAGVLRDAMSHRMTEEQWDTIMNIHLKGTFFCSRTAFEYMKLQNNGRIINTSSTSSQGNIGQANYAAAKAGIIGLTKTLALEYARYQITVNAVAPGFITTSMTAAIPTHVHEAVVNRIPLKRKGEPEEVANLHLFLASDESSYITGQVVFIDGGGTVGM
ncbi:3-oxoacyl-ACP reductase FabG [Candidatus Chlorohelix sp.]|uniref:3-oxoacyl-ACP reductase FabG n=1 Tax=Candidatus Chlorohelix sp. TaxID=3139201 RepID=UPI00303F1843